MSSKLVSLLSVTSILWWSAVRNSVLKDGPECIHSMMVT